MSTIELLQEEKKKLLQEVEALLTMIPTPVLVVDQCGDVIHTNSIAEKVWQMSQISLANANITDLVLQEEVHQFIARGKSVKSIPVELKDSAGSSHPYICRIHPLFILKKAVGAVLQFTQVHNDPAKEKELKHEARYSFDDIRGHAEAISFLKSQAQKIASSDSTILIRGESGTGKEVLAQAIHGASRRKSGPFVALNCAAIPDALLESELFGYEEGAFTGAKKGGKQGRFEMACGGTLFLDEIGDMPPYLQAKLLRVLQERRMERIGGAKSIYVDVRVIAATHKDLEVMIANQQFREDLYYRLNVIPLSIPPLRERKEDLIPLIDFFLKKVSRSIGKEVVHCSSPVLKRLYEYHWPGNIRELENVIEYMVHFETGDVVTMSSMPVFLRTEVEAVQVQSISHQQQSEPSFTEDSNNSARFHLEATEQQLIQEAIRLFGTTKEGKRKAAESLGISIATLYRRLQKMNRGKRYQNENT